MANERYLGKNTNLYLDESTTNVPSWKLVACLTETGMDGSRDTIDAGSKCGSYQASGNKTDTASFTGFFEPSGDTDKISLNELAAIYDSGESRHWKISDDGTPYSATSPTGTPGFLYYREFNGSLTAYTESDNQDEAITFTGTIAISGDIIRTAPSA
jgi:hypothetical protein